MLLWQSAPELDVMRKLLKDTVYIVAVSNPLTGFGKVDKLVRPAPHRTAARDFFMGSLWAN